MMGRHAWKKEDNLVGIRLRKVKALTSLIPVHPTLLVTSTLEYPYRDGCQAGGR